MKSLLAILFFCACASVATPPALRYYDNGDGTVTDRDTGLMWLKDAVAGGARTWDTATNYVANLTTNGYSDWRLGSVTNDGNTAELDTLGRRDGQTTNVWDGFGETPFVNTENKIFWSSVTWSNDADYSWSLDTAGHVVSYESKLGEHYVWPVRGPVPIPPYIIVIGGTSIGNAGAVSIGNVRGSAR